MATLQQVQTEACPVCLVSDIKKLAEFGRVAWSSGLGKSNEFHHRSVEMFSCEQSIWDSAWMVAA